MSRMLLNDILRALKTENVKAVLNGSEAAANNVYVLSSPANSAK